MGLVKHTDETIQCELGREIRRVTEKEDVGAYLHGQGSLANTTVT